MKHKCIIKSHPKGITLVMDPDCDFVELVEDICRLFARTRDFFGRDEMILAIEGRSLSPEETMVVVEAVELNSNLNIPLLIEEGELRDVRMTGHIERYYFERSEQYARIIRGNVSPGDEVTSDTGLIIIGDVKRGAFARAVGSIMVFGRIEGEVHAGAGGDKGAFIVAGRVDAPTVRIGNVSGPCEVSRVRILGRKKANEPVVIKIFQGKILAEPLSSGLIRQNSDK